MSLETTGNPSALPAVVLPRRRVVTSESAVLSDLIEGCRRWYLWRALAFKDIRGRYRRTVIGPFWTALNTAIFVAALGAVYALLWHQPISTYLPFFCAGYIAWYLFMMIVNESGMALITEGETVKSIRVPYSVFILRVVARNLIVFFHNLVVFAVVGVLFRVPWGWTLLLLPIGLFLALINYFWIGLLLATVCARFRDVLQLVNNLTQILFFVTPIFWQPTDLRKNPFADLLFVKANPASHLIAVIRAPLLGHAPGLLTYAYLLAMLLVGGGATLLLVRRVYGRIAYWL